MFSAAVEVSEQQMYEWNEEDEQSGSALRAASIANFFYLTVLTQLKMSKNISSWLSIVARGEVSDPAQLSQRSFFQLQTLELKHTIRFLPLFPFCPGIIRKTNVTFILSDPSHTRLAVVAATHCSANWFLYWFQVLLPGLVLLQSDRSDRLRSP